MRSQLARAVARVASLTPEERWFAIRAWVWAPAIEASLAIAGLQRTMELLSRARAALPKRSRRDAVTVEAGRRLVTNVYSAHLVRGACLPQSVLQYWLHQRDGTAVRLVLGVRRPGSGEGTPHSGDGLEAHAWVEASDISEASDFVPLYTDESPPP